MKSSCFDEKRKKGLKVSISQIFSKMETWIQKTNAWRLAKYILEFFHISLNVKRTKTKVKKENAIK